MSVFVQVVTSVATDCLRSLFEGSSRWAVAAVAGGGLLHGVVVGRRIGLDVVPFLALQRDGLMSPVLVPRTAVTPRSELEVRQDFVLRTRRAYVPRGHAFAPSPVCETRCATCGLTEVGCTRERVQLTVERALGTDDVCVYFKSESTDIDRVTVRDPEVSRPPAALPVGPHQVEDLVKAAAATDPYTRMARLYRDLTAKEWHAVTRALDLDPAHRSYPHIAEAAA